MGSSCGWRRQKAPVLTELESAGCCRDGGALAKRLCVGRLLGTGSWSAVHIAIYDGLPCALKVLRPKHANVADDTDPHDPATLLRKEGRTLLRVGPSPHLVRCLALLELPLGFPGLEPGYTEGTPALVLELMEGGSLADLLGRQQRAPWRPRYSGAQALQWAQQLAAAVAHLHAQSPPVLHRDVKCDNVLFTRETGEDGRLRTVAKLGDLGLCACPAQEVGRSHTLQPLFRGPQLPLTAGAGPLPALATFFTPLLAPAAGPSPSPSPNLSLNGAGSEEQLPHPTHRGHQRDVVAGKQPEGACDSRGVPVPSGRGASLRLVPLDVRPCAARRGMSVPYPWMGIGAAHAGTAPLPTTPASLVSGTTGRGTSVRQLDGKVRGCEGGVGGGGGGPAWLRRGRGATTSDPGQRRGPSAVARYGEGPYTRQISACGFVTPAGVDTAHGARPTTVAEVVVSMGHLPLERLDEGTSAVQPPPVSASMGSADAGGEAGVQSHDAVLYTVPYDTLSYEAVYRLTGQTGSYSTMSPEVYSSMRLPYNEKADVFSFGVLLYELFSRTPLLVSHIGTKRPDLPRVLTSTQQYASLVARGYRPGRVGCIPGAVWALITECWQQDPNRRPPMGQVLWRLQRLASSEAALEAQGDGSFREFACGCFVS